MLIAFDRNLEVFKNEIFSMTDSMNFGPDWIRNLSSEGSTGGGTSSGTRYQLADYRYGREEMLALFDKNIKPPTSLTSFKSLYSDTTLLPLALLPSSEEERGWQGRPTSLTGPPRGRGGSLERGGRIQRGRGAYQSYGRPGYESGWGNGEQPDWSPRKEYGPRTASMDNWRRARNNEEDDGWRNISALRGPHEKWGRSVSWRGDGESEERGGPPERGGRANWQDLNRGPPSRRSYENEDHLPEWANESPSESGGTFDEKGAFHGSDDEQLEGRDSKPPKREGIQKSTSQQHISHKVQPPLPSSKSTMSLVQPVDSIKNKEDPQEDEDSKVKKQEPKTPVKERKISVPNIPDTKHYEVPSNNDRAKSEGPPKIEEKLHEQQSNGPTVDHRTEVNDFERLQEDFVLKLMGDEETTPKPTLNSFDMSGLQPPPNLTAPVSDKWFYQDPQGQMQGPFVNSEMAEWYKAGYFSHQLKVRRQADERFFLLGELINMCGGSNPFQTNIRFPILRNDISKMPEPEMFQYLSQVAAYKQAQARIVAEPWSNLTLQQQELAAQRLVLQQQQQVPQDPYMQPPTNPLMHMISQMQQANKLPNQGIVDKPVPNLPTALDPHLQHMQHMGNLLSLQNRLPGGLPNHGPTGPLPGNLPGSIPPESLSTGIPNIPSGVLPQMSGLQAGINAGLGINMPRSVPIDQLNSGQDHDPISSLLKQLHQQKQQSQQMDTLWQQNQFGVQPSGPQQWQPQQETPMSMWDLTQQPKEQSPPTSIHSQTELLQQPSLVTAQPKQDKPKEQEKERLKEDAKEAKKRKELEEKQAKKEAEERRKLEQRKLEADKRAEAERRKNEEERIRKELEKVKREAEEKRLKELEEKRRLKEQRKAEDEARKRMEEMKKNEEERLRLEKEQREQQEERRRAEEKRQEQIAMAKAAPWSHANSTLGLSLTDIQKAEREKRAQDAALMLQKAQMDKEIQQQQQQLEKPTGLQLSWAKKPVEPRKVKSLAEIQAEEQERLAKEAAETRLRKEKEAREVPQVQSTAGIWSGQNLSWANSSSTNWSSSTSAVAGGFWEDTSSHKHTNKPSTVSKSNSTNTISNSSTLRQQHQQVTSQQKNQQQPAKPKPKKEESKANHNNNNGPLVDEFSSWCFKTLATISTNVDVPTFVSFLRDIESAYDVREYCKEYLGESNATHQFANNFLEKRRSFKPKNNAHKDDLCSPAPAITPSMQHSTEFQEVKGKNKKIKKSKMLKVDARILGFNVTSAPDRINVGDRDYGDNS